MAFDDLTPNQIKYLIPLIEALSSGEYNDEFVMMRSAGQLRGFIHLYNNSGGKDRELEGFTDSDTQVLKEEGYLTQSTGGKATLKSKAYQQYELLKEPLGIFKNMTELSDVHLSRLLKVYSAAGGNQSKGVVLTEVFQDENLSESEAWTEADYMEGEGWISVLANNGPPYVRLTHQGIKRAESVLVNEYDKSGAASLKQVDAMTPMPNVTDTHNVFVVHGRNLDARNSIFRFLRSIGLRPLEWSQAIQLTGKASPFIGEILDIAFSKAQAVVVLMTPDDVAQLKEQFRSTHDPSYEAQLTGQARPNVLFEAGMAMGRSPDRTIIVELGELRPFSDIAGRHTVRLSNISAARQELAQRLETAGCPVDLTGTDWHAEGDFSVKRDIVGTEHLKQNRSSGLAEQIIYDGSGGIDGFDFRGQDAELWTGKGADAKPISPRGHGALRREEGGILNVQRTNTDGRFEVWLQRFSFDGKDFSYIPKNLHISGKRKLRISFEAKAVGGEHTLRLVIRIEEGSRLAEDTVRVSANEWKPFEVFLQFDPAQDCQLRIDDEDVSKAPSSVQIRNIVVAERK